VNDARAEADRGGALLRRACGAPPPSLRQRYGEQCAALAAVGVPSLAERPAEARLGEFMSGAAAGLLAEWQSGDALRKQLALVTHCEAEAARHEHLARALETQLARDGEATKASVAKVAEAQAAEKGAIFERLRAKVRLR